MFTKFYYLELQAALSYRSYKHRILKKGDLSMSPTVKRLKKNGKKQANSLTAYMPCICTCINCSCEQGNPAQAASISTRVPSQATVSAMRMTKW